MSPKVEKRRPDEEAAKLPATPNPLPIRMGPIGNLPQTRHQDHGVVTRKYGGVFDLLQSWALGAYGFDLAHPVLWYEAPFVEAYARRMNLELHDGTWATHLAHDPGGHVEMPYARRPHGLSAFMARLVLNAQRFGARTFTFCPPVTDSHPFEEAGAELERLRAHIEYQTRGRGTSVDLHVINGYHDGFSLWRLDDVIDFGREHGIAPTIELGFAYATGQCPSTVDAWREFLRRCPARTLFVYSIGSDVDATGVAWTVYDESLHPEPSLPTFLEALREDGRRATVLLQAHHEEFSITEAVDVACRVWDVDVPSFLQGRQQKFRHKPFTRPRG